MNKHFPLKSLSVILFFCLISMQSNAQTKKLTAQQQAEKLSKEVANPVASLISFPLQNNFDYNYGSLGGFRYTLNVQPVIPAKLGSSLTLINRFIVPVINQKNVAGATMQTGLGNATYSGFFSPKTKGIILGIGPEIGFPSTNEFLGAKNWLGGPTIVALVQPPNWTVGILSNNLWALNVDSSKPNVNNLYFQPFISYRTKGAFTFGVSSENTYDWLHKRLSSGMIQLFISQIFKFGGKLPANIEIAPKYFFANSQVPKPEWGVRVVLSLLFPE